MIFVEFLPLPTVVLTWLLVRVITTVCEIKRCAVDREVPTFGHV